MVSKTGSKQSLATGEARRKAILAAVRDHWTDNQRPPSMRELAAAVGVRSKNAVREHVARLVDDGLLVRDKYGRVRIPEEVSDEVAV